MGQHSGDGAAYTGIKVTALAAGFIESQQRRQVFIVHRPAESPACNPLEHLPRTGGLFGCSLRIASRKDAIAARRATDTGGVVGAAHFKRADAQDAVLTAAGHIHLQAIFGLGKAALTEGHHQLVHTGLGLELDVLEPQVDGLDRRVLLLVDGFHIGFTADAGFIHLLTIEGDDQRVLELHVVDPKGLRHVGDVDDVLTIGRTVVIDRDAAARAQRQAFFMEELRARVARAIGGAGRQRVFVAHGLHGHGARGADVLIEKRRRHLQGCGYVVKAFARFITRQ